MMNVDGTSPQIIDQMDQLWQFFAQTRGSSLEEKIHVFRKRVIEPNSPHYSCVFGISDDVLRRYILDVEPKVGVLRSSQDEVIDRFCGVLVMFRAEFPEFRTDFVTYLLPSLNLFKGMALPSRGRVSLLLGIDALTGLRDNQFRGYITHELFHAYHFQRAPAVREATDLALRTMKMPALWALLWTEGIACYAVRVLHPDIPEEEVLDWCRLLIETKPRLPDLVSEARKVLRSDAPGDIAGFFYFPRQDGSTIPTGCGYYIGMLVAGILAMSYSIDHLVCLGDEELIGKIDSALMTLQEETRS